MKFYLDNTEDIFLYQLLKAAGAIEEYSQIRQAIHAGEIKVNGQTVFKQRLRVFPGDEVAYKDKHMKILAGKSPAERPPKPENQRIENVYHGKVQRWRSKPLRKEKSLKADLEKEVKRLHNQLLREKYTLSIAESCTGGMAGSYITSQAGSSEYYQGGVISYSNQLKIKYLSVGKQLLEKHGAVSGQVAEAMSLGVQRGCGSELSAAITGIAGPEGGEPGKPVGTVYIAVHHGTEKTVKRFQFKGTREEVRLNSCLELFRMLDNLLSGIKKKDHD